MSDFISGSNSSETAFAPAVESDVPKNTDVEDSQQQEVSKEQPDKPESNDASATNDSTVVDSTKKVKRSFSSYLSNIGQRKLELAEQERKKKEELEKKQREEAEKLEKEAREKELKEKEEAERKERELLEKAEQEKQLKLQQEKEEQERLERERAYLEQKQKLEDIAKEKEDQNQQQEEKPLTGGTQDSSTLSDLSEEKLQSDSKKEPVDISRSIPEDLAHSDNEEVKQEIDSDAETIYGGSPLKVRRGRLIKKSELDKRTKKHSESEEENYFDDDDDVEDEDEDEEMSDHANVSPKIITSRQHLFHSRSVSPTQKGKAQQKPKKRRGRDSSGRLKLQRACEKGKYDEAKLLIEEGADVNDQDYAGNSALHEASLNGHTDIVQLLIENGAEVDLQSGPDDLDTPLIDAASNGHVGTVNLLLKYGADPRIENAHGQNALDSIDEDLEESNSLKNLLKKAAKMLFKKEQESKSRVVSTNHSEDDSEHDEHRRSRSKNRQQHKNGNSSTRKDLIFVDFTSKSGRDEVYQRASDGDSQYVGTYLGNGGKPDSEAMTLAAKYGHLDVVSLFLGFGAKVDVANKLGMTALMRTVGRGHLEVVKLLIESGADPLRKSKDGKNSFDYAKDALIFDSEEVEYLRDIIEKRTGEKLEVSAPPDINTEDILGTEEVPEIKIKKRKVSTNDTTQQQPEHKKKKTNHEVKTETSKKEAKHETFKNETFKNESKHESNHESKHESSKHEGSKHESSKSEEKSKKPYIAKSTSSTALQSTVRPVQRKVSQPAIESDEEKQIRIQKEKEQQKLREKYQSEIAEKQQKRQEKFLSQFESQELKKQEELKKLAELEEERRVKQEALIKQREKEEEERREMMNKEEERDRRLKIRADYPFALRVATFNDNRTKEEALQFLPLYYWKIDDVDYIVDIQIILALGLESFRTKYSDLYKDKKLLSLEEKAKVFNIMYPILRDNSPEARKVSYRERTSTSHNEFKKFNNVQVHWIRLDEVLKIVENNYGYLKDVIESRITRCSYDETPNETLLQLIKPTHSTTTSVNVIDSRKQVQQMEADLSANLIKELPHSLRYRPAVIKALVRNRRLW